MSETEAQHTMFDADDDVAAIVNSIFRAGAAFDGYASQMRRALSLNANEGLALAALWSRGPMSMTELGARIPLSRAAVTTLVDRLEAAGLVHRRGDSTDRRRTVVEVSEPGIGRMNPVIVPYVDDLMELARQRSPQDWAVVERFLDDVHALHDKHAARLASLDDAAIRELARAGA